MSCQIISMLHYSCFLSFLESNKRLVTWFPTDLMTGHAEIYVGGREEKALNETAASVS